MELIKKSEDYHNKLKGGYESLISEAGFPNLFKKIDNDNTKIKYEYNMDKIIEKERINIKNILIKRREEVKPLIELSDDDDDNNIQIKKTTEITTNINIDDIY